MCRFINLVAAAVVGCWAGLAYSKAPPVALASVYEEGVDVSAYWVSEKLDGVRALWDGEALYSRRGNRFAVPSWFLRGFPATPLDGELWIGRGSFEVLSGAVRREVPDARAWRRIRYMVFDLPDHVGTFDERLHRLLELIQGIDAPYLELVVQFRVESHEELMAEMERVVARGGEGLMLRRADSRHRAGRSDDLLKVKPHQDAEAVVVAHLPGKGRFQGMLGSLLVETPTGRRFRLGTGFTDAERSHPPELGATVTYRHRGKTANGTPRFASYLRVREEF
ncbi:MAG: DNA ligase [Gammaproteobacteria bacterium]|nr:DNA ligase [Gammaproteobacteria bacterium]